MVGVSITPQANVTTVVGALADQITTVEHCNPDSKSFQMSVFDCIIVHGRLGRHFLKVEDVRLFRHGRFYGFTVSPIYRNTTPLQKKK